MNRFLSDEIGDLKDWFQDRQNTDMRISGRAVKSLVDQLAYLRSRACELEEDNSQLSCMGLPERRRAKKGDEVARGKQSDAVPGRAGSPARNFETGADDPGQVFITPAWDRAVPFDEVVKASFAKSFWQWPADLRNAGAGIDDIRAWLTAWLRHWTAEFGYVPDARVGGDTIFDVPPGVLEACLPEPPGDNVIAFPSSRLRRTAGVGSPDDGSAA